tara:strand:+ start:351 stop:1466 length:1116 start_codon:yes stop_codon:yes gene_type:complete
LDLFVKWEFEPVDECFLCSQKHKLYFRNARNLYKRKCDSTGQNIVSVYKSDSPYKIYRADEWYSDKWDSLEHGRDFDFSRSFFEQFQELRLSVPRQALNNVKAENSEFCNMTMGNKNCYLVFGGDFNEDTMYGTLCMHNKQLFDGDYTNDSELCYMMSDSVGCYECRFVFDSKNCTGCAYVSDCTTCNNCILCTNLSQKSYCIRNQQLSKEEYEEQVPKIIENMQKASIRFEELKLTHPRKAITGEQNDNVSGEYINESKDCSDCFDIRQCRDCRYCHTIMESNDCMDYYVWGMNSDRIYECLTCGYNPHSLRFCVKCWEGVHNLTYCFQCTLGTNNCFGCVAVHRGEYCILNKQYSKEEYEELVPKCNRR